MAAEAAFAPAKEDGPSSSQTELPPPSSQRTDDTPLTADNAAAPQAEPRPVTSAHPQVRIAMEPPAEPSSPMLDPARHRPSVPIAPLLIGRALQPLQEALASDLPPPASMTRPLSDGPGPSTPAPAMSPSGSGSGSSGSTNNSNMSGGSLSNSSSGELGGPRVMNNGSGLVNSVGPSTMPVVSSSVTFMTDIDKVPQAWSLEEWQAGRRLIRVWYDETSSALYHTPLNAPPPFPGARRSHIISCIYWASERSFVCTSVDCLSLLEFIIGRRFTVDDKNRIRRNLEGFQPTTVSKSRSETAAFFRQLMDFPKPRPRKIEKDVKVFPWRILPAAIDKIVSRYQRRGYNPGDVHALGASSPSSASASISHSPVRVGPPPPLHYSTADPSASSSPFRPPAPPPMIIMPGVAPSVHPPPPTAPLYYTAHSSLLHSPHAHHPHQALPPPPPPSSSSPSSHLHHMPYAIAPISMHPMASTGASPQPMTHHAGPYYTTSSLPPRVDGHHMSGGLPGLTSMFFPTSAHLQQSHQQQAQPDTLPPTHSS